MTNAAATQTTKFIFQLTVVKGKEEYDQQVCQLTHIAWQIGYTALWNGKSFSTNEIAQAKKLMQAFIVSGSPLQQYHELTQRVLLARQYILNHPGCYASLPSCWLQEPKGFAGTKRWYEAVEKTRAQLPGYKQPLKALPAAVLEVLQTNTATDFHYWRSWFAERDAQGTLNLFLSVLGNSFVEERHGCFGSTNLPAGKQVTKISTD